MLWVIRHRVHSIAMPLAVVPDSILTVYPKKYAHGFCFAVLCCGYTLTDFPISIRLTSLALWQSNDCPSASKATLMNMDKYFMWIHYERLHNHNKAKHNKTVYIFLGIYCSSYQQPATSTPALKLLAVFTPTKFDCDKVVVRQMLNAVSLVSYEPDYGLKLSSRRITDTWYMHYVWG